MKNRREVLERIRQVQEAIPESVRMSLQDPRLQAISHALGTINGDQPWPRHNSAADQSAARIDQPASGIEKLREPMKLRTNNLERAIEAAMRKLGHKTTLDDLITYLAQSDESGFIRRWDGQQIVWFNTKGEESKTGRRGIEKHRRKYATTR